MTDDGSGESSDENNRTVYLAEIGQRYEPAGERRVFSTEEKAERWLSETDLEMVPFGSIWRSVTPFTVDSAVEQPQKSE